MFYSITYFKPISLSIHLSVKFSLRDLFEAIGKISYRADIRMRLAEDSNKVSKLVSGANDAFKSIVRTFLQY